MALAMFAYLQAALRKVVTDQRAQDGFEYMLVIGGVSVAIIVAIATPVGTNIIDAVVGGVCTAIDGVFDVGDCSTLV